MFPFKIWNLFDCLELVCSIAVPIIGYTLQPCYNAELGIHREIRVISDPRNNEIHVYRKCRYIFR